MKTNTVNDGEVKIKNNNFINPISMTYEEWLNLMEKPDKTKTYVDYSFPNDQIKDECLQKISDLDEGIILKILKNFLLPTGHLPVADKRVTEGLIDSLRTDPEKTKKELSTEPHLQRLLDNYLFKKNKPTWDGIDWVMGLVPHNPQLAIEAIQAYVIAHFWFLPDGRLNGLFDSQAIIRKRYLEKEHPIEVLQSLTPRQFEILICNLYDRMDFKSSLTQVSRDGGRDIIAEKIRNTGKDRLLIQCKRVINKIGVGPVREMLGILASEKATKSVIVSLAGFTRPAFDFQKANNHTIELIDAKELMILLNTYCGADWPIYIDRLTIESSKQ